MRTSGVWDDEMDDWMAECARHVGMWDRHLALITAAHLFNSQAYNILADGFRAVGRRRGPPCEHCGSPLIEVRWRAPLADQPDQFRTDCPLCGGREAWSDGGGRLSVALSGSLTPGTTVRVTVCVSPPRPPLPAGLPPGVLVVKAHDKGQQCVFFRTMIEVTSATETFEIAVPHDIAPELHTLQVGWFAGLDCAMLRQRWPALPG
jgi:hypothetical protein